jgi:glucuronate isomerase
MPSFLHDDFLLETELARDLYRGTARDLPIIDYHCHLSPELMAEDHRFRSITEIWLDGDHYKWRAMRACGVPERLITGDASDWEKFAAWAQTVPATLANPLYHWAAMELKRPFGIDEPLTPAAARDIFEHCNAQLSGCLTTMEILRIFRVAVVCSTDDPADTLAAHRKLAGRKQPATCVYPTWRPDKALTIDDPARWNEWVGRLEQTSNMSIGSWKEFLDALQKRHSDFHELGCRASDHGLDRLYAERFTDVEATAIFDRARRGAALNQHEVEVFRSALLYRLAILDHERGWVQQFHLGALRNTNTRMRRVLGPDTGYDAMGDSEQASHLARFLDRLDETNQLAKTIVYNVNPAFNAVFVTIAGCFQDGITPGKVQWGAAWWFLDQLDGMEAQMRTLANMGLLSQFVGMVTDSRSFLSWPRHDYFRRLLCRMLGEEVRQGRLPRDTEALGELVADVCCRNALNYFRFQPGELWGLPFRLPPGFGPAQTPTGKSAAG